MKKVLSFSIKDNLAFDVPAAVVVSLVALPLCLGIALASGAPLFSGLIAGIVGGIVAGSLSKSHVSVSGPAAGLSTVVLASIHELGSFSLFLCAVVLAGAIQIALGYLRAGKIGNFFPASVVRGMLAAIGLILILKQVPHALGYDADFEGDQEFIQADGQNTFSEILASFQFISGGAIIITLVSLAILLLWDSKYLKEKKWIKVFPAPLLVVGLGIFLNLVFNQLFPPLAVSQKHLVDLSGFSGIADLGKVITFVDLGGFADERIYLVAFTIALVASLETLLSIEAADKLDVFKRVTPLNHELKAQGMSNMISGALGGLPITAVIVRTSANINAGARSKISAILHSVILVIFVVMIPSVLELIPLASLAAILLMVGYKLTPVKLYKEMFQKGREQFLPFVVTVVTIIFFGLLVGVAIGVLASVFVVLKNNFRSAIIVVNNNSHYLIKFTKDVSFLHKSSLRSAFDQIPQRSSVIIDASKGQALDVDIVEAIEEFIKTAPSKEIAVDLQKKDGVADHLLKSIKSNNEDIRTTAA